MIPFIHVSLDTEVPGGAGYIRYSREKAVRQDTLDADDFAVAVDLDAQGKPVGIELTALDLHTFDLATRAARKYGLAIPDLAHAALAVA